MKPITAAVGAAVAGLALCGPGPLLSSAYGSGLSAPVIGTSASSAVNRDPAAVYWNPAMLGPLLRDKKSDWLVGASILYLDVNFDRERLGDYQHRDSLRFLAPVPEGDINPELTGAAGTGHAAGFIPAPAPQLFFGYALDDEFAVGMGMFVPFGAVLEFPDDGPQKWALQSVELLSVEVSAAASWRAHEDFSIGVGGGLVGGLLRLRKVVDLASTPLMADAFANPPIGQPNSFGPSAPSEVRELDILSREVDIGPGLGWTWVARAGVEWRPIDDLQLGLAYMHRVPMVFNGGFVLDMDDPFFTIDLEPQGLKYPGTIEGEAEVEFPLPPSLNAGASYQIDSQWTVAVTSSVFFNSVVDELVASLASNQLVQPELGLGTGATVALPRRWADTVQVELRGMYRNDAWHLGGMVGYHTPASPEETVDVASPDGPRVTTGITGGYHLGKIDFLGGGLVDLVGDAHVQYVLPRTITKSDYDLSNGELTLLLTGVSGAVRVRFD